MAWAWGTLWVTGMNSTSNGPIVHALAVGTGLQLGAPEQAGLLDAVAGQPERQRRAVDRHAELAQEVLQAADVVLVAVRGDDGDDPIGVLAQVREVGQHEVDAVHVRVGEHQPAVDEQDAAVGAVAGRPSAELDRHAVATDLAETAEEDDPDGVGAGRRAADRCCESGQPRAATRRVVDLGGPRLEPRRVGVHRRAALPGRLAEVAQHRLGGSGVRRLVAGLELPALEQAGVDVAGRGDVAALPGVEQLDDVRGHPVGGHADRGRRRRPPAAAASGRRRRCRPRSRPAPRRRPSAVSPGLPAASLRPTMLGTSWARRTSTLGGDLAPGADGDVVDDDRQVGGVGDGPQVGLDAGLRRAVVVRAQREDPGDAELGRLGREVHRVGACRRRSTRRRRGSSPRGDGLPQRQLLVVGQRRRLAGGAGDDQALVALLLQPARPARPRRRRRGRARRRTASPSP